MKRFIALLLAFLTAFSTLSLAENAVPERTPAEKELDGLTEAHLRTKDLPTSLGAWEESGWYAAWLETYGLSGTYRPGTEWAEIEEENAVCSIAYDAWTSLCGITMENDFSIASETFLYEQVTDDVVRQLWLVVRVHDQNMPNFYVLIDRDTQKVLATSDVSSYQAALAIRIQEAQRERKMAEEITVQAKSLLLSLYASLGITSETLDAYDYSAFPVSDDLNGQWYIWAYAPYAQIDLLPDFQLITDAQVQIIHFLSMTTDRREQEQEIQRQAQLEQLQQELGDWGSWSIEEKSQYAPLYNGETCYGVPGKNDLPYEKALEIARETLLKAYPELTKEILDSAELQPCFFVEPHRLYGTVYEAPFYFFTFLSPEQDPFFCYEIILDGKDGQVYLTHDSSSAGNG